eukprot:Seg120.3 transcript_id=Seg120.3/GoldUCD/mRNA.D3Y31 product="hypothetical protein" protein_id=Seg120.3/GoldUCD/D3Y31
MANMFTLGDVADILDDAFDMGINIVDALAKLAEAGDKGRITREACINELEMPTAAEENVERHKQRGSVRDVGFDGGSDDFAKEQIQAFSSYETIHDLSTDDDIQSGTLLGNETEEIIKRTNIDVASGVQDLSINLRQGSSHTKLNSSGPSPLKISSCNIASTESNSQVEHFDNENDEIIEDDNFYDTPLQKYESKRWSTTFALNLEEDEFCPVDTKTGFHSASRQASTSSYGSSEREGTYTSSPERDCFDWDEEIPRAKRQRSNTYSIETTPVSKAEERGLPIIDILDDLCLMADQWLTNQKCDTDSQGYRFEGYGDDERKFVDIESEDEISPAASNLLKEQINELDKETARAHDIVNGKTEVDSRKSDKLGKNNSQPRRGSETEIESNLGDMVQQKISDIGSQAAIVLKSFEALKNLRHYDESGESVSSRTGSDRENSEQFLDEDSGQYINKGIMRRGFNVSMVPDEREGMLAQMERNRISTGEGKWNAEQYKEYDQGLADFEELENKIEESEKEDPADTLEGSNESEKFCADETATITEETYVDGGFREKCRTEIVPSEFQIVYENAQRVADLQEVERSERTDSGGNFMERYRAESVPSDFQMVEDVTLDYFDDHVEIVNEIEFEDGSDDYNGVPGDKKRPGTYVLKNGQSGSLSSVYEEPVYISVKSERISEEDTKATKRPSTFALDNSGSFDRKDISRGEDIHVGGSAPESSMIAQAETRGRQVRKRPGTFVLDNSASFDGKDISRGEDVHAGGSIPESSMMDCTETRGRQVRKRPGTFVLDNSESFDGKDISRGEDVHAGGSVPEYSMMACTETRGRQVRKRPETFVLDSGSQFDIVEIVESQMGESDPEDPENIGSREEFSVSIREENQKRQVRKRPGTYVLDSNSEFGSSEIMQSRASECDLTENHVNKVLREESSISVPTRGQERKIKKRPGTFVLDSNREIDITEVVDFPSSEGVPKDDQIVKSSSFGRTLSAGETSQTGQVRKRPGTYVLENREQSDSVEMAASRLIVGAPMEEKIDGGSKEGTLPAQAKYQEQQERKGSDKIVSSNDKAITVSVISQEFEASDERVMNDPESKIIRRKSGEGRNRKRPETYVLNEGQVANIEDSFKVEIEREIENTFVDDRIAKKTEQQSVVLFRPDTGERNERSKRKRPGTYVLDTEAVQFKTKTPDISMDKEIPANVDREGGAGLQREATEEIEQQPMREKRKRPGTFVLDSGPLGLQEVGSGIVKEDMMQTTENAQNFEESSVQTGERHRPKTYILDSTSYGTGERTDTSSEKKIIGLDAESEIRESSIFEENKEWRPENENRSSESVEKSRRKRPGTYVLHEVQPEVVMSSCAEEIGFKSNATVKETPARIENSDADSSREKSEVGKGESKPSRKLTYVLDQKSHYWSVITSEIQIDGKTGNDCDSGDESSKKSAKRDLVDGLHEAILRKTALSEGETLTEHVAEMKVEGESKEENTSTDMKNRDYSDRDVASSKRKSTEGVVWNVVQSSLTGKANVEEVEEKALHKSSYKGKELRRHSEYVSASESSEKREIKTDLTKQNSDNSNTMNSASDEQNRCFSTTRNSEELNNNQAQSIENDVFSFSINHSEMADEKVVLSTHSTRDCFLNENYHKGTAGFNIEKEPVEDRITNSTKHTADFVTREEVGYLSPENDNIDDSRITTDCKKVSGFEGDKTDKESVNHYESHSNHERNANQSSSLNFNGSVTNFDAFETKTEIAGSCCDSVAEHLNDSNQGVAQSDVSEEEMAKIALKLEINLSDLTDDWQIGGDDSRRGNYSGSAKAKEKSTKSEFDSSFERAANKKFIGSRNETSPNFDNNNQKIQLKLEIDKCKSPENDNSNENSSQGIRFDIEFDGDSKKATSPPEELKKRLSVKSYSKVKNKTGTYVVNSPIFSHHDFTTENAFEESFARSSLGSSGGEDLQREIRKAIEEGRLELERTALKDSPDSEIYPVDIKKSLSAIDGKLSEEKQCFAKPWRKENVANDENLDTFESVNFRENDKTARTTDRKLKTRTYVLESNVSKEESENVRENSENVLLEKSQVQNTVESNKLSPRAASPRNKGEKKKTGERKPDRRETLDKFRKSFGKQRIGFFVDLNKGDSKGQDENDDVNGKRKDFSETEPRKLDGTGAESTGKRMQEGSELGDGEACEKFAKHDVSSSRILLMEKSPVQGEEKQTQEKRKSSNVVENEERDCFDVRAEECFETQTEEQLETKTKECAMEAAKESFEMRNTEYCQSEAADSIATDAITSVSVVDYKNKQIANISNSATNVNQSADDTLENSGFEAGYSLQDNRPNTGGNIWTTTFIEDKSLTRMIFNNSSSMLTDEEVLEESSCGDLKGNLDTVEKNRDKSGIIVHNYTVEDAIRTEEVHEIKAEIQSEVSMQNEAATLDEDKMQIEAKLQSKAYIDKEIQTEKACFSEESTLVESSDKKQEGDADKGVIVLRRQTSVDGRERTKPTRYNSWEISPVVEKEVLHKISTLTESRNQLSLEETTESRRLGSASSDEDLVLDGHHTVDSESDKRVTRDREDIIDSPRRRNEFFVVDYDQPLESEEQSSANDKDLDLNKEDVPKTPRQNSEYFVIENELDRSKSKRRGKSSPRQRTKKESRVNGNRLIPTEEQQTSGTGVRRNETFVIRKSEGLAEQKSSGEGVCISQENREPERVGNVKIRPSAIETKSEPAQRNLSYRQGVSEIDKDSSKEVVADGYTVMAEKTSYAEGFINRDEKLEPRSAPPADNNEAKYLERGCLEETVVEDFDLYVSNGSRPASNISEAQSNTEASEEEQALTEDETGGEKTVEAAKQNELVVKSGSTRSKEITSVCDTSISREATAGHVTALPLSSKPSSEDTASKNSFLQATSSRRSFDRQVSDSVVSTTSRHSALERSCEDKVSPSHGLKLIDRQLSENVHHKNASIQEIQDNLASSIASASMPNLDNTLTMNPFKMPRQGKHQNLGHRPMSCDIARKPLLERLERLCTFMSKSLTKLNAMSEDESEIIVEVDKRRGKKDLFLRRRVVSETNSVCSEDESSRNFHGLQRSNRQTGDWTGHTRDVSYSEWERNMRETLGYNTDQLRGRTFEAITAPLDGYSSSEGSCTPEQRRKQLDIEAAKNEVKLRESPSRISRGSTYVIQKEDSSLVRTSEEVEKGTVIEDDVVSTTEDRNAFVSVTASTNRQNPAIKLPAKGRNLRSRKG